MRVSIGRLRNRLPVIPVQSIAAILVGAAFLGLPAPAAALSGGWRPQPGSTSLLLRVRVVCSRERHGNVTTTHYCNDGYQCLAGGKCGPGPAMRREIQRKLDDLNAAMKRNLEAAEAARRRSGGRSRRRAACRAAALGAADRNSAALDAVSHPHGAAATTCIVPRGQCRDRAAEADCRAAIAYKTVATAPGRSHEQGRAGGFTQECALRRHPHIERLPASARTTASAAHQRHHRRQAACVAAADGRL